MKYEKTYKIKSPVKKVWQALTDASAMEEWGAGPADVDLKKDGKFRMWGNYIFGRFIEIKDKKMIVQEWTAESFDKASEVTIELAEKQPDQTEVKLTHKGIPKSLHKDISQGWDEYYFGAIKEFLESKE